MKYKIMAAVAVLAMAFSVSARRQSSSLEGA
jgi:hypothetical protein